MPRKKPPPRLVVQRTRNNAKRRLVATVPTPDMRRELAAGVTYGAYAKHKHNPTAYKLAPYAGQDEERTYCDAHASFGKQCFNRIRVLLSRGVILGLWSEQQNDGLPSLLWTIDETGWIFELRITNPGHMQYHGYPVLRDDAFARHVLVRARAVDLVKDGFSQEQASSAQTAIKAAEVFYR